MDTITNALASYGAGLTADGFIQRGEKVTGVRVTLEKAGKRVRLASAAGATLATGPTSARTIADFVEGFWFWKRVTS